MMQSIKFLAKYFLRGRYFSLNQLDRKLEKYIDYDNGYFVELGANDGVTQSNSLYFEKYRNWRGLLVEPAPQNYLKCRQNRSVLDSIYCAACVSFDYPQEFVRIAYSNLMSTPVSLESDIQDPRAHAQLGDRFLGNGETVFEFGAVARTLNSLLLEAESPSVIDFLSLDVEGAELEVLKGVDHQAFRFKYLLVECRNFPRLSSYLTLHGYRFVEPLSSHDYLFAAEEYSQLPVVANKRENMLQKLRCLFSRYPKESGVHPAVFSGIVTNHRQCPKGSIGTLAFQSVPDKFYFLLFGAIRTQLQAGLCGPAELVVVRAISGSVGTSPLAELKRLAPVAYLWSNPWVRAYGALIDGVAYRCATWTHPFSDLADWIKSGLLWRQLQQQGKDYSLLIDGIEVADLVIDSYLRFKPSPEFDVSDPFVQRLVWQALRDVQKAQTYFGRVKPRLYLTPYTTYLEHGIPVRAALLHGVDVWSFGNLNCFGKLLSLGDNYHTQDFSSYRTGFEALDRQEERLQQAREHLENRMSGGIDAATSYMRQSAYAQSGAELPAGLDGAVVIFLHDFYDSPHGYPELVFHDFWCWICFTVEVLQKSDVTFFLKPHPNQIALSDSALGRLREKYPDLKWLPAAANNVKLAQAGISCGVTVYGTVAHELAYLGVPSIGCARHPHHTFDFCRTAHTREEYQGMLKTHATLPVQRQEGQRQALAFYYMHNLHGSVDERELQQAFAELWRVCNVGVATEDMVMQAFLALVNLPAFDCFVTSMASSRKGLSEHMP